MSRYWNDIKAEMLEQSPEFRREYELIKMKKALIKEVISYRETHSLTQKEFAERIGVKQQAISRFEKGVIDPRFSFIGKVLLEILGDRKVSLMPSDNFEKTGDLLAGIIGGK
jgi:transcriptional regulator with XRE-family HTH domain